jgi:hypothetical protein
VDRGPHHHESGVRWAEGRSERFAEIAAEFVRLKVDVIVHTPPLAQPIWYRIGPARSVDRLT